MTIYMNKKGYVYILASKKNGTLYVGVTSNLPRRIEIHQQNLITKSFTSKYTVHCLVYYEIFEDVKEAIAREKQMKHWNRNWKIKQINKFNPVWEDLYSKIC